MVPKLDLENSASLWQWIGFALFARVVDPVVGIQYPRQISVPGHSEGDMAKFLECDKPGVVWDKRVIYNSLEDLSLSLSQSELCDVRLYYVLFL